MNTFIRTFHVSDLEAVLAIEQQQAFPWTAQMLQDCLQANYACYVLEREQTIIGYGILMVAGEQGDIVNIAIASSHRRHGYGYLMLQHLLGVAKERRLGKVFFGGEGF